MLQQCIKELYVAALNQCTAKFVFKLATVVCFDLYYLQPIVTLLNFKSIPFYAIVENHILAWTNCCFSFVLVLFGHGETD